LVSKSRAFEIQTKNCENHVENQVFSWWLDKRHASLCAAAAFFPEPKTYRQSIRYFCIWPANIL